MTAMNPTTWVVFEKAVHGRPSGLNAVCAQAEWDRLAAAEPGRHTLIKAGLATEGEAERYARGGPRGRVSCLSADPHAR